jgi:hypothetical protein
VRILVRTATPFVIAFLLSLSALAHPGHGEPGAAHYVTEPDHLVQWVMLGAIVALALVYRATRRRYA